MAVQNYSSILTTTIKETEAIELPTPVWPFLIVRIFILFQRQVQAAKQHPIKAKGSWKITHHQKAGNGGHFIPVNVRLTPPARDSTLTIQRSDMSSPLVGPQLSLLGILMDVI